MDNKLINDRYQIISEIGHGGYSKIFLAIDTIKQKEVAVKVLKKEVDKESKDFLMIRQEAMTMAALNSSHIARIYECGIYNSNPYIVMDYVKGKVLKDIIKTQSYLLVEEVYEILMQVIDGLEAIHNSNMVHRDIKPNNIIRQANGNVCLVDFGTTVICEDDLNLYRENKGSIICTVHYMAPELLDNPMGSAQSDIYALGISIFEMFTGKLPYNSSDKIEIIKMHKKGEFPDIKEYNPNVPKGFEKIILKCVEGNLKKRYKNVNELKVDLIKAYKVYKSPHKNIFERLFK